MESMVCFQIGGRQPTNIRRGVYRPSVAAQKMGARGESLLRAITSTTGPAGRKARPLRRLPLRNGRVVQAPTKFETTCVSTSGREWPDLADRFPARNRRGWRPPDPRRGLDAVHCLRQAAG